MKDCSRQSALEGCKNPQRSGCKCENICARVIARSALRGFELLLRRDLQSRLCALQSVFSSREISLSTAALKTFFRALLRLLGSFYIDFFRTFRCLRQNNHSLRKDFGKAPGYREIMRLIPFAIANLADGQLGDEWRMPR